MSWDLQTGGIVSVVEWKSPFGDEVRNTHITYSKNGKMVAVLIQDEYSAIFSLYDIVSGIYVHEILNPHGHTSPDRALYVYAIWTHGESLRFATPEPTTITIWEVEFAPGAIPVDVEALSIPDSTIETFAFTPREQLDLVWTEFHPVSCRLAFTGTGRELLVWDARSSKFLLHCTDTKFLPTMTFSSDGCFLTCPSTESDVYLWKESPSGYTLFAKLTSGPGHSKPLFSPNGGSIIRFSHSTIWLWRMKSFTATSSRNLTQPPKRTENFLVEFLPDKPFAAIVRKAENTVVVIDLESSVPQLTISTSIEVYGLRSIDNTIVIIGDEKAITWNLPEGKFLPNARMNVEDSTQTIDFRHVDKSSMDSTTDFCIVDAASISHDLQYIALGWFGPDGLFLDIYCTSTGEKICAEAIVHALWFAPSGNDIWCAADNEATVFTVSQDTLDDTKTIADSEYGLWGCPWGSSHGYKVTGDGWILGTGRKKMLLLPPLWQSTSTTYRVWRGKFVALLHGTLSQPIILELEP